MQKILSAWIILVIVFHQGVFAKDIDFKAFLESVQSSEKEQKKNLSLFVRKNFNVPETCNFDFRESMESIKYFQLVCGHATFRNFLYFGKLSGIGSIASFQIKKAERIGNKFFYILGNIQFRNNRNIQISGNKNLAYFLENISKNELSPLETLSNQYIYFDKTCPLEFISRDSDFHWEKIDIYNFRVSCLQPENSYTITLQFPREQPVFSEEIICQPGKIFHARIRLENVSDSKITWKNFETIP